LLLGTLGGKRNVGEGAGGELAVSLEGRESLGHGGCSGGSLLIPGYY
jgi:hypothetical protein